MLPYPPNRGRNWGRSILSQCERILIGGAMTAPKTNPPADLVTPTATVGGQISILAPASDPTITRAKMFESLDRIIKDQQLSFQKIGMAFARIKAEELWSERTSGWSAYCRYRGCSPTHANRQIRAAHADEVIRKALRNKPVSEYPQNEWQIRPMVPELSDDGIVQAWLLALELAKDRKPIQKNVRVAVKQILGETELDKPNKKADLRERIERLRSLVLKRENAPTEVTLEMVEKEFRTLIAAV